MEPLPVPVVGRLAPSPTGALHVGNARSFLGAWLSARSRGGILKLRIEDIDSPRVKPESTASILEDLAWLGLDWDGAPQIQTERVERHRETLNLLAAKNLIYPCICSRADVERAASAPHLGQEGPRYPGTCAHMTPDDARQLTVPFAWRYRFSDGNACGFVDGVMGAVAAVDQGDFVIWKAGKGGQKEGPAYQLAVVVDDHDQEINEVVRGGDLLESTARQISLARALGWSSPAWFHLPLVIGTDGKRLAKRHGDTRIASLRKAGVKAERLCAYLAWSLGWLDQIEPCRPRDLLTNVSWRQLRRQPWVLTAEILEAMGYRV